MAFARSMFSCLAWGLAYLAVVGCSSKPDRVKAPPIKPASAAEAILLQYDDDGDGQLSRDEFSDCPALEAAIGQYDKNGDQHISMEELTTRFSRWVESGLGVSSLACRVTMKGRPLVGAEIEFIPEACFEGAIQQATGTTDESGTAMLSVDVAHLPADAHNMRGVQQGLYRVRIHHADVKIPSKYNTETELGREVSFETGENFVTFSL